MRGLGGCLAGVHGGLCSSAPGVLDKMYERHKRRYSLCDISKVDRTVDVVLLKVRCLCTFIYGFLSPSLTGLAVPRCTRPLSWTVQRGETGGRALALQHGGGFVSYQTISCQILSPLQPDNLLWCAVRHPFAELSGHLPCPQPLNGPLLSCQLHRLQVGFLRKVPFSKGFSFPVVAFGVEMMYSAEKGMVDPPFPLFFVCV